MTKDSANNSRAIGEGQSALGALHLKEAFAAAASVKGAVEHAVSNKFLNTGGYKSNNILDLPVGDYMAIFLAAVMTAGIALALYDSGSQEANAKKDNYRRYVEKHFETMSSQLKTAVKKLPDGKDKAELQSFRKQAHFAFQMEKAANAARESGTFRKGLKAIRAARPFSDKETLRALESDYLSGNFPSPGGFLKNLKTPGITPEPAVSCAPANPAPSSGSRLHTYRTMPLV